MTTLTELLKEIATDWKENQTNSLLHWDVRSEIPNETPDENKNLLAVLHINGKSEVVKGNKTFEVDVALTGQILIGEYGNEKVLNEVKELELFVSSWCKEKHYTNILDAVMIEAMSETNEVSIDGVYLSFNLPMTFIVQL